MTFRPTLFLAALAICSLAAQAAAAEPRAAIRGDMDAELRRLLERAVGLVDGAPESRFEARRRAQGAMAAAEALLRSEAYYQPVLEDVVEGEERPSAIVAVQPGPRFLLTQPTISWLETAPDAEGAAQAQAAIGLKPGDPGRAVDVIAGEGRAVASLSRNGYADAKAEPRRVVVDHAALTVAPEYHIDSGRLVLLDGVVLQGAGRTNPAWVARLAPWKAGDRYDPEQVGELERRLLDTGVYDGVGVALSPLDQTQADGRRPVVVNLNDRPRRVVEAGATWSTAEGAGVDFLWTRYNRLGRADTLALEARFADIDSRIGGDLSLPHWRKPGRTLKLSAGVVKEDTDAYDRTALVLAAELQQRIGRTSYFNYGLGLDAGQYNENRYDYTSTPPSAVTFDRDLAIVTGRTSAYIDNSNDPLNPTRGWRMTVSVQPTAVAGEDTILFLRSESQATAYLPLQDQARTVLAGRVRIGAIIGGSELSIPSDRLFYSGGGGSVRGYSYQGVNPELPDETPRGGLSLFETSLEVRHDIGQSFQAVAFLDAGAVGFQETPNLTNMRYGAGVGVRYKLPFGPIRADIAMPLDQRDGDSAFQIYISIGQAF
ncbi:autotransporter assembly complex protein TamA [Brevundimonas sp. SL130]|uniref:autotransporter assembly complex protein TamA n=1 Tax=Brevundimonas sp. SL130 TaxID=2995143 RepID=UPI00226CE8EA|nr:autotransporter assembly complex family protein [Brevundimonas sp. SL130]WAC60912.1 autotransporter assembly complex protein TamA [Brevundimonas sp. SL130]